jgi:hypothetical protein
VSDRSKVYLKQAPCQRPRTAGMVPNAWIAVAASKEGLN